MNDKVPGLLDGIRVVEMSHIMAAPTGGMMLADMGADVIKVERLPQGDDIRRSAPMVDGESAPFTMMNRNKRGVALDMRQAGGRYALRRLVLGGDVFIENYRKGAMEHYGLGEAEMRAANPKLVYCSVSGFGQTGPYAGRGGFDLITQGMSGLMSITGEGEGRPPVKVGAPVTDITAGILAALGICGALVRRGVTGRGQYLDTSLLEAGITHTYWQTAIYRASGEVTRALGSAHPLMAPYQAFPTKDGWINLGAANQSTWEKFVVALGAPELGADPRFNANAGRLANRGALTYELTRRFATATTAAWLDRLEAAGVPAGPVYDVAQMAADPQVQARGMIAEVSTAMGTPVSVIGHAVKYSDNPATIRRGAPRLGEHTREVLEEYGFSGAEIDALVASGAAA
ncbi:MAG: CoA transferase [Alphaproteobacteria bacterium]|nr:CoA transferase [Alphaproteobacteria bacterium]